VIPASTTAPTTVRLAGAAAALGLAASALLHAVWLVAPWPLATWAAWSRAFGGADFRVPGPVMGGVALLFAAAAYVVAARATLVPPLGPAWLYRVGSWVVAGVLVARALVGFVEMPRTLRHPATPDAFRDTIRLYLRVYLPLFLALGAASAYVAAAAGRRRRPWERSTASPRPRRARTRDA
jgi:UDP-N-acetylmuramyl pentapeptide phosphotransferase/UDP-N-acetylglucosamine-1-phosphate transferase